MSKEITLITGAGSGIGLAIANKFYKENHNLVLLVKTLNQKKDLEKRYDKKSVRIYHGDLSKNLFLNQISKKISYVHNLINNAASRNDDHLFEVKKKDLDYLINLNFKSTFLMTQIFSKKMIKKKGSIINLSSQLGHIGAYNRTVYCSLSLL